MRQWCQLPKLFCGSADLLALVEHRARPTGVCCCGQSGINHSLLIILHAMQEIVVAKGSFPGSTQSCTSSDL